MRAPDSVYESDAAMIKALQALLGKTPRELTAKKPAAAATGKPSPGGRDYRAVSLASSGSCCAAAKAAAGQRYLLREAPRLPLPECTMPTRCSCRFRKDADRRDGERRLFAASEINRWFSGPEGRKRKSRRSMKA
jgi:hypothetical protein